MTNEKTIHRDASTNTHIGLILSGITMVVLSLYLTVHYFSVRFPTEISKGSLCDINSFLNCDAATLSPFSNIFGVPISVFGMIAGLLVLVGYLFNNRKAEATNAFVITINFIGCVVLFIYSLVILGSLCPFCTLYYIASGAAFFIYFKYSDLRKPDLGYLAGYAVITLLIAGAFYSNVQSKSNVNVALAQDLMNQYDKLPKLGAPAVESPFRIASMSERFDEAPLQITMFSDFQCPACKMLSDMAHEMEKRYRGKINIQYMFYPLDHNCNDAIERPIMPLSCQAAYLTTCLGPEKFLKAHDDIFANQQSLSLDWIKSYARRNGVEECLAAPETKAKVVEIINQSRPFNITSTPTMLVNGAKIVGVVPANQLFIIFDEILKREK